MINIDYLIKSDAKGYFGAFSKAGKNSAEILVNIRQKDRLLNPQKYRGDNKSAINFLKRNGYHNIYGDNEMIKMIKDNELDDSQIEEVEEEIDIFKMEDKKTNENLQFKKKPKIKKKELVKYFHRTGSGAYKFHDLHRQKGNKIEEFKTPNCTKYNPNKNCIMRRTLVGPEWEKLRGRLPLFGKDNTKFYLNHEDPLKDIGGNFIDMDKQTMRGELIESHDLRILTYKPFVPKMKKNKTYQKMDKSKITEEENIKSDLIESEYSEFNKTNPIMVAKNNTINNSTYKSKQKRVQSAVTTSTRPQTGRPKNLTTLTSNNSKQINNTSNSIGGRNITSISRNLNANNLTPLNRTLSEEKDIEICSMSSSELNDSYNQFKNVYQKQIKPKNENQNIQNKDKRRYSYKSSRNSSMRNKQGKQVSNNKIKNRPKSSTINLKLNLNRKVVHKKRIKGPDFDKAISREYYDNLTDHGATLIPFSLPNFKQVRERPLSMVIYERPTYKKKKKSEIIGITPDMYNDIYRYLESINNYKKTVSPRFEKMTARPPMDDSPLPVYMKGEISRGACEMVTDTTLKMNNFAEGKFISSYTSFWPKKSFNKIVNLNLLNSDAFLANLTNDQNAFRESNNYVAKTMKFYHKNYEDLLKEGLLNKFDNVTYKTIKPDIKTNLKYMDKFLKKYEKELKIQNSK